MRRAQIQYSTHSRTILSTLKINKIAHQGMKLPESSYNLLRALCEFPIGVLPLSMTPSISNAIPNELLKKQKHVQNESKMQVLDK